MSISIRSVLTAGIATLTASALVMAPSVQPPPPPAPTIQLAASNQSVQLLQYDPVAEVTDWLIGIVIPPGFGTPPPPLPVPPPVVAPNSLASVIETTYAVVEPWVDYGFELGAWAFSWIPWIGWLAPQIWPLGYNFGEDLVSDFVFNFTDWLEGNGSFVTNLVDWGQDSFDSLVEYGIAQWNYWAGWLPLPPLPGIFAAGQQATMALGLTSQSPFGNITDALAAANKKFFDITSGATEFGLFKLAEPVLRELKLGLVADQVDINYFDLFKPTTIQQLDGLNELLTVPDRLLTDLKKGADPLQALTKESAYAVDRVVTRTANAGQVVENYVHKQVEYFTKDFPTPPNGKLETIVGKTIAEDSTGAAAALSTDGKGPLKKALKSVQATPVGQSDSAGEDSGKAKPIKTAVKRLTGNLKSLRDGAKRAGGVTHEKTKDQ